MKHVKHIELNVIVAAIICSCTIGQVHLLVYNNYMYTYIYIYIYCDVIVLIIISAHAPARERALFKVEHVVSTVTNLGACPGAGTPKTSLFNRYRRQRILLLAVSKTILEVNITFVLCVDFTKASAIILNQPLEVLGTGLTVPTKVFRRISVVLCCSLFFSFFVTGYWRSRAIDCIWLFRTKCPQNLIWKLLLLSLRSK